jgi:hypothetical protein
MIARHFGCSRRERLLHGSVRLDQGSATGAAQRTAQPPENLSVQI